MTEHVDEVNFALDGLQPWQPARIRRASLLSLLNICSTAQHRRLFREQGMEDMIIDALLSLNFDDSASTVGAAALFYVLACDDEVYAFLDSPARVRFLLKLLNPPINHTVEKKTSKTSFNLFEIHNHQTQNSSIKGVDSISRAIISKVKEILLSCNEIQSGSEDDDGMKRPELSSKWITLLTMEKACLSTVSFEDTTEITRKVGGNFKESLRELKGLDAIFDVIADCHSALEGLFKEKSPFPASKDGDCTAFESVALLLKCLKIMENATFMSEENQNYLLIMKAKSDPAGVPLSFVGIIIRCIKILSGLSLLKNTSSILNNGELTCLSKGIAALSASEVCTQGKTKDVQDCPSTSFCGTKKSRTENIEVCHKRQKLSTSNSEVSTSSCEFVSATGRTDCPASTSYTTVFHRPNGVSCTSTIDLKVKVHPSCMKNSERGSGGWISIRSIGSKVRSQVESKKTEISSNIKGDCASDQNDPFAFDEGHLGPSKWEKLSSENIKAQTCSHSFPDKEYVNGSEIPVVIIDDESSQPTSELNIQSSDNSCPSLDEASPSLLEDCLLTSVKVLMNLTNDNPVGCQQIGACGGMDTLASLIASHFPSFNSCIPIDTQIEESIATFDRSNEFGHLNDIKQHDHELDLLVAIMGLLVNLVEKDSLNRLRLASARVLVNTQGTSASKEIYRDVVPLLCSIFMSNQGAENDTGEEEDDEACLLQGQREAEMMIIEAYTALLLAFLSTESTTVKESIARFLPNHRLQILVPVLERFVAFHFSLNMISSETHSAVVKVIESCKEP